MRSSARAGSSDARLPCSQLRTVSTGTPMRRANVTRQSPDLAAQAAAHWRRQADQLARRPQSRSHGGLPDRAAKAHPSGGGRPLPRRRLTAKSSGETLP